MSSLQATPTIAPTPSVRSRRLPVAALRRRQIAAAGWVYLIFIALGTILLGTFVVAFLASLKIDPLERPFRLMFDQINPAAWVTAADLGRQGAGDPLWGGFAPGADITFSVTYTAPPGSEIIAPEAEIPRRRERSFNRPGGRMIAAHRVNGNAHRSSASESEWQLRR